MRRLSVLLLLLVPLAAGCGSEASSLQGSGDALKDASSSRIEWKLEGKGMPEWALMRSTGSIDYANGRGEMVIKGKSDSAPEARALFIGRDSYLGAEVGGKTYWMKESIYDATGAHRFEPGPGGTSPDRLLKSLVNVEHEGREARRAKRSAESPRRITGRTSTRPSPDSASSKTSSRPSSTPGSMSRDSHDAFECRSAARTTQRVCSTCSISASRSTSRRRLRTRSSPRTRCDKLMEKECAAGDKAPEDLNPLCALFTATLMTGSSSSGSGQISPTETVPTTEGK